MTTQEFPFVKCPECGTGLAGATGKDPYAHLLNCLHASAGPFHKMRETAAAAGNENGRRICFIIDAVTAEPAPTSGGE